MNKPEYFPLAETNGYTMSATPYKGCQHGSSLYLFGLRIEIRDEKGEVVTVKAGSPMPISWEERTFTYYVVMTPCRLASIGRMATFVSDHDLINLLFTSLKEALGDTYILDEVAMSAALNGMLNTLSGDGPMEEDTGVDLIYRSSRATVERRNEAYKAGIGRAYGSDLYAPPSSKVINMPVKNGNETNDLNKKSGTGLPKALYSLYPWLKTDTLLITDLRTSEVLEFGPSDPDAIMVYLLSLLDDAETQGVMVERI